MAITVFTDLYAMFDQSIMATIQTGSSNVISLISPLLMTGLSIYIGLIGLSYLNGSSEISVSENVKRLIGWSTIMSFGMNIEYYTTYVVPFLNGFGDDIAQALTSSPNSAQALDTLLNAYLGVIVGLYKGIEPWQVGLMIQAVGFTLLIIVFGVPFMAVAIAYITLAHFALGLLLAMGPMFIATAMFPATRQYFQSWLGQCLNYGILVALMAAACALEVQFATKLVPTDGQTLEALGGFLGAELVFCVAGLVFFIISLNLPSLASQLTGGVGISSMVGKVAGLAKGAAALASLGRSGGGGGGGAGGGQSGGSMTPEAGK